MNDDELKELFSAFGDIEASDGLKAATLGRITNMASAAPSVDSSSQSRPSLRVMRGGRFRAKWRNVRVAAVAACLTLALSGGVAYATPTSYVTVNEGGATIELGVNMFGYAVTATSNDDAGKRLIEEGGLLNMPLDQSIERATSSMLQADVEEEDALVVSLTGTIAPEQNDSAAQPNTQPAPSSDVEIYQGAFVAADQDFVIRTSASAPVAATTTTTTGTNNSSNSNRNQNSAPSRSGGQVVSFDATDVVEDGELTMPIDEGLIGDDTSWFSDEPIPVTVPDGGLIDDGGLIGGDDPVEPVDSVDPIEPVDPINPIDPIDGGDDSIKPFIDGDEGE